MLPHYHKKKKKAKSTKSVVKALCVSSSRDFVLTSLNPSCIKINILQKYLLELKIIWTCKNSVLRECGTPLKVTMVNTSMPTGAVKSSVSDLLLNDSILHVSHVNGKNNALIKHNRHMWSSRLSVIYLKLYLLHSYYIECRESHILLRDQLSLLNVFILCLKQIDPKLMFKVRSRLQFKRMWKLCFLLQGSYPDPFNSNDISSD